MRKGTPRITVEQWDRFLALLRLYGNHSGAARASGFDPKSARRRMADDTDFAEECESALEEWRGSLMEAGTKRARDGYPELISNKDGLVIDPNTNEPAFNMKYSDNVLITMLKGEFKRYQPQPAQPAVIPIPDELQPDPIPTGDEPGPESPIL